MKGKKKERTKEKPVTTFVGTFPRAPLQTSVVVRNKDQCLQVKCLRAAVGD
jgi:hypothetical protein